MRSAVPAGISQRTPIPFSSIPPSGTIALLARERPAAKLSVEEDGRVVPAGKSRKSPLSDGRTAVTLATIALASGGIPQPPPVTARKRVVLAESPVGDAGERRVSTSRQGLIVKRCDGTSCCRS